MKRFALAWLLPLLAASTAVRAQNSNDFALTDRDRSTVGVVVAKTYSTLAPDDPDQQKIERGTGVIVSGEGHVLTAGHVLRDDIGKVCRGRADAPKDMACQLTFYWKGDVQNAFALEVISAEQPTADFALLRLPRASDKIGSPVWPSATLAERVADNEALAMTGYTGSTGLAAGSANPLELTTGRLLNGAMTTCAGSDAWGLAREMDGKSSPGWSGAPVFNRNHRLAGIVLGRGCTGSEAGSGDIQDKAYSRVLPIGAMTGLCNINGFACYYGVQGDLTLPGSGLPSAWRERLVGGPAAASSLLYGWRVEELANAANFDDLCRLAPGESRHLDRIRSDLDGGVQLAVFYDALVQVCRFGQAGFAGSAAAKQLVDKANQGLEPAMVLAAQVAVDGIVRQRPAARYPYNDWNFSDVEKQSLTQSQSWLTQASDHGWQAASYLLFEGCRMKLFACQGLSLESLLQVAASKGQPGALRDQGVYLLAGSAGDDLMRKRTGFSLPQDITRGTEQLIRAGQPRYGSNESSGYAIWDQRSSAYLTFFHAGGTYQGQVLVGTDLARTLGYFNQCVPGMAFQFGNPIHDFCGFAMSLGRFNNYGTFGGDRAKDWQLLTAYVPIQQVYYPLAQNLKSWSSDGSGIDRIDCPLAIDMTLTAPPVRPKLQPRVAYCFFKKGELSK